MHSEVSHKEILKILPKIAERLKEERLIVNYKKEREKEFKISIDHHLQLPPIIIRPDLTLELCDERYVIVEVANACRDPKRFVGEIMYPYLLKAAGGKVVGAFIFAIARESHTGKLGLMSAYLNRLINEKYYIEHITLGHPITKPVKEKYLYMNLKASLNRLPEKVGIRRDTVHC